MTLDSALKEWSSKKRRMGCVSATEWLCKRLPTFKALRLHRYTKNGEYYSHVVGYNGVIIVDLAPYADKPRT